MNVPAQGRNATKFAREAARTTQAAPWLLLDSNVPLPRPARRPTLREIRAIARDHLPAARVRLAKGWSTDADSALLRETT